MKTMVLVDDDPAMGERLRRVLKPLEADWRMVSVEGGQAALDALAAERCDVIMTDMQMPGKTGVQLLEEVRTGYPHVVRVLLMDPSDQEGMLRSVGSAHPVSIQVQSSGSLRVDGDASLCYSRAVDEWHAPQARWGDAHAAQSAHTLPGSHAGVAVAGRVDRQNRTNYLKGSGHAHQNAPGCELTVLWTAAAYLQRDAGGGIVRPGSDQVSSAFDEGLFAV